MRAAPPRTESRNQPYDDEVQLSDEMSTPDSSPNRGAAPPKANPHYMQPHDAAIGVDDGDDSEISTPDSSPRGMMNQQYNPPPQQHHQQPNEHIAPQPIRSRQRKRSQPQSKTRGKLENARAYEYMRNPTSVDARRYLRERFGIPYEKVEPFHRNRSNRKKKKLHKGPVNKPAGVLPVQNRTDPTGKCFVAVLC